MKITNKRVSYLWSVVGVALSLNASSCKTTSSSNPPTKTNSSATMSITRPAQFAQLKLTGSCQMAHRESCMEYRLDPALPNSAEGMASISTGCANANGVFSPSQECPNTNVIFGCYDQNNKNSVAFYYTGYPNATNTGTYQGICNDTQLLPAQ